MRTELHFCWVFITKIFNMQHLKVSLLSILFLFCILNISLAQINGNGQMQTISLEASAFTQLHANFPIELILDNSQNAQLEITTDENVLAALKINTKGGEISILQDKWVEPTKMVQVKGSLPALKQLKMQGYGRAIIRNLKIENFDLDISVGTAEISGQVDQLRITTNTGDVNALNLIHQNAKVEIKSFGTVQVNTLQTLQATIAENATIIYQTKPEQIIQTGAGEMRSTEDYQQASLPAVSYVDIQVKNNKSGKIDTYVQGPKQQRFSYGLPFKGQQSRTESWPVGTKIYLVNRLGARKLLYTVREADANQTVALFTK